MNEFEVSYEHTGRHQFLTDIHYNGVNHENNNRRTVESVTGQPYFYKL